MSATHRTVFVTGATGFIGSHLVASLVQRGHTVRCATRATSRDRWLEDLGVERVEADVRDRDALRRAMEGTEVVVHGAGVTSASDPQLYDAVNVEGTRNVARAAHEAGATRVVLLSSLAARGPDGAAADGRDRPSSAYGASKLAAEKVLAAFEDRLEGVALRLAAVYGPRDRDLLPLFQMAKRGFLTVPATPDLRLQPLFVEDAARVAVAAVERPGRFGPFAVAEPRRYSWSDLLVEMERVLDRRIVPLRVPARVFTLVGRASEGASRALRRSASFDERRARDLAVHTWTCDTEPVERALGWSAEVPLPEGLERTARWYEHEGWI